MPNSSPPRQVCSPRLRIDELSLRLRCTDSSNVAYELVPARRITAAQPVPLPLFDDWTTNAECVISGSGVATGFDEVALEIQGRRVSDAVGLSTTPSENASLVTFCFELVVPVSSIASALASQAVVSIGLSLLSSRRLIELLRVTTMTNLGESPRLTSLDVVDITDATLFDGPKRHLFDLQNPEEGFWRGSGSWRLALEGTWKNASGARHQITERPMQLVHRWMESGTHHDMLWEDITRRCSDPHRITEFMFDTSHPQMEPIPPQGRDIPLDLRVSHELHVDDTPYVLTWSAPLPLRVRDPSPLLGRFKRLSAVGIDFGTTSTVAAYHHKGYRSLLQLGGQASGVSFENPTYLLIENHKLLWQQMDPSSHALEDVDGVSSASGASAHPPHRFPNLLNAVKASHGAYREIAHVPNAVVGELKSLPARVILLDQAPQLRDREKQDDFLLDEPKVRALIRAYAYLLGRAINRPGQDVYLQYWLTHPAKVDKQTQALLEQEIRAGIRLSIPQGIDTEDVVVSMRASEPEAFAAEVCPELAADASLAPLIERFGELRFAVFDFGGGTLDIACGKFRPATEAEILQSGASTVIETLQVAGDDQLGGDYLTHELAWLTHQHDKYLPEMQDKQVPMMRPTTVPPNVLSAMPFLYKRSLAGRQNMFRFERELDLESVKFKRDNMPRAVDTLQAVRLDGADVQLTSLSSDREGLHRELGAHLQQRIRDGVKLLASVLRNTSWGGSGDWIQQGVVILLAGNSSRSEYLEQVLQQELGVEDLKIWRPGQSAQVEAPRVVLFEVESTVNRGVRTVGVTPKTAVALGTLRIANREVHLVRQAQGFGYHLGDLRGFPPKFVPLIPMGIATAASPNYPQDFVDFGTWDGHKPLRLCKDYEPNRMTGNDPRLVAMPTNFPLDASGRLFACPTGPDELTLHLERVDQEALRSVINLAKYID